MLAKQHFITAPYSPQEKNDLLPSALWFGVLSCNHFQKLPVSIRLLKATAQPNTLVTSSNTQILLLLSHSIRLKFIDRAYIAQFPQKSFGPVRKTLKHFQVRQGIFTFAPGYSTRLLPDCAGHAEFDFPLMPYQELIIHSCHFGHKDPVGDKNY